MLLGLQGSTREYIYSLPGHDHDRAAAELRARDDVRRAAVVLVREGAEDPDASLSPVAQLLGKFRKGPKRPKDPGGGWFAAISRATLKAKWIVVAVSFGSLFLVMKLPVGSEFFPQDIRDQFTIDVWLPEGANIHQTNAATKQVEEIVRKLGDHEDGSRLRAMASYVGGGMPRWYLGRTPESGKFNFAELVIRTTDGLYTNEYAKAIQRVVERGDESLGLEPVNGARIIVRQLMMGPVVDAPIGFRIYGPRLGAGFADPNVMREQSDKLEALFRARDDTWDVYDTWGSDGLPTAHRHRRRRANLAGVTNDGIARTLNAFFSGHKLTTFREEDHQIPVYLRLPASQRGNFELLRSAFVEGVHGKVPLDSVATVKLRREPAKIERRFCSA